LKTTISGKALQLIHFFGWLRGSFLESEKINPPKIRWLGLREEFPDQTLLLLVFDPGKKLCAKPGDCLRSVERHLVVNFASRKMTRLAAGLKDRFDLGFEVRLFSGGGERQSRKAW